MRQLVCCALLVLMAAGGIAIAEPITIGESVTLTSKIMGEERTILVSTPPGYEQSEQRYPVLYMTDGAAHLTHTRGTVDFLARNGLMPQLIVVGVPNTDRTRDLTPTNAGLPQDDGALRELPTSGGASRFLDFFEQELFPHIDAHYRTLPLRLFAGHSFGGLFALNALCTRPEMFKAILAVSPSLQWDDELPLRQAKDFFDNRERLDLTLFVAMANEEEGDPQPTRLDRLEQILASAKTKGFAWQVNRMPEETHGSVVLRAHYWGLRKVFEGWRLPTDPATGRFTGSVEDIKKHYTALSNRLGVVMQPAENMLNQTGYQVLGTDVERAIAIFQYNVELYPGSANVYDSLGEALERAGRLQQALDSYTRAVDTATELGDQRLEIFTANRDRVRGMLEASKAEE